MGAGLKDVMHHTIFLSTGKTSAHYSCLFMGVRFFHPSLMPHVGFRFNCVRSSGFEEGFDRHLNLAPSARSDHVQMHEEGPNQITHQGGRHLEVLEDSCSFGMELGHQAIF